MNLQNIIAEDIKDWCYQNLQDPANVWLKVTLEQVPDWDNALGQVVIRDDRLSQLITVLTFHDGLEIIMSDYGVSRHTINTVLINDPDCFFKIYENLFDTVINYCSRLIKCNHTGDHITAALKHLTVARQRCRHEHLSGKAL